MKTHSEVVYFQSGQNFLPVFYPQLSVFFTVC
jgi:hypothetical protein